MTLPERICAMPTFRWSLGLALLLVASTACQANVALPVYKDDPGYDRARLASWIAPFAVLTALLAAALCGTCARTGAAKLAALAFGVLVLLLAAVMALGTAATRFPDEPAGSGNTHDFLGSFPRPRGSPRPLTPEETTLAGILILAALCFGVMSLLRRGAAAPRRDESPSGQDKEAVENGR
jgi:uncharacterized membrane protein YfcA